MDVSLDQAIEIYARVLKYWHGDRAPGEAHAKALECKAAGDIEGFHVWVRVAKGCEALHTIDRAALISGAE